MARPKFQQHDVIADLTDLYGNTQNDSSNVLTKIDSDGYIHGLCLHTGRTWVVASAEDIHHAFTVIYRRYKVRNNPSPIKNSRFSDL